MSFSQYTSKDVDEVLGLLKSSKNGLSKKEASLALEKFGPNEIKVKNINGFDILIRQLKSPFFYLLFIAAIISLATGQAIDTITIVVFTVVNVFVGFFQEYKAEKAIFLLRKYVPQKVKVLRKSDDKSKLPREEIIDKIFLVPGDIVVLQAGDFAPADLRTINVNNFLVDESVLTGESVPVSKISEKLRQNDGSEDVSIFIAKNIIFSGTLVISGKVTTVVVSTGKDTVFGGIVKTVSGIKRESAYEKSILYFSKLILKIVTVTIFLVFLANVVLKGIDSILELLLFSVALIVSILPEALPAVVSFALSQGSLKLAKQNVVVKRLSAIEDLGNIEVLASDKTGTLTENKMSLTKIISSDKNKSFLYGILGSGSFSFNEKILNPFDYAIFQRAPDEIIRKAKKFKIISELPFDSYRMRSSFLIDGAGKERILIVKGAPETVLNNCNNLGGKNKKQEIIEDTQREGNEGKRVLVLAFKKVKKTKDNIKIEDEKGLTFLGYFIFDDPLKSTVKESIELAKKMGVQIKIITGDSKEVSGYVARKAGLSHDQHDIVSGRELEKMTKEDFDYTCQEKLVFARISPDVKHRIIKSLQKKYEVGFLGEGVNDAPALKTADVGIAVSGASDIARESSDVVLLQKDLRVIINGIKEGRTIFANINKYIKCALAGNIGNFYSIAVISLFINFLPMLPIQILLGNLLSDFPLIAVATDSVDVEELKKPKNYQLHNVLSLIISLALVSTVFDFIFFSIFHNQSPANIQTLWFVESILTEIALIFVIRTSGLFYKAKKPAFWLLWLSVVGAGLVIGLPFMPIGKDWFHFVSPPVVPLLIVFILVIIYFVISEIVKLVYFHYFKPGDSMVL